MQTPQVTAQAWQESLSELCGIADEQIDRVSLLQKTRQPHNEYSHFPAALSAPRPQSASRSHSLPRSSSQPRQTIHGRTMNYPAELVANREEPNTMERRVDFLMKKVKSLDEKLKRTEKESFNNANSVNETTSTIAQLVDSQTQDRKLLYVIKEQQTSLSSQLAIIQHSDNVRDRASQRPLPGECKTWEIYYDFSTIIHYISCSDFTAQIESIDIESIKEVVFRRIQADFSTVIQEVVRVRCC